MAILSSSIFFFFNFSLVKYSRYRLLPLLHMDVIFVVKQQIEIEV